MGPVGQESQGEFIWILGGGNDPVALPDLDTLDERERAGVPHVSAIASSSKAVRRLRAEKSFSRSPSIHPTPTLAKSAE